MSNLKIDTDGARGDKPNRAAFYARMLSRRAYFGSIGRTDIGAAVGLALTTADITRAVTSPGEAATAADDVRANSYQFFKDHLANAHYHTLNGGSSLSHVVDSFSNVEADMYDNTIRREAGLLTKSQWYRQSAEKQILSYEANGYSVADLQAAYLKNADSMNIEGIEANLQNRASLEKYLDKIGTGIKVAISESVVEDRTVLASYASMVGGMLNREGANELARLYTDGKIILSNSEEDALTNLLKFYSIKDSDYNNIAGKIASNKYISEIDAGSGTFFGYKLNDSFKDKYADYVKTAKYLTQTDEIVAQSQNDMLSRIGWTSKVKSVDMLHGRDVSSRAKEFAKAIESYGDPVFHGVNLERLSLKKLLKIDSNKIKDDNLREVFDEFVKIKKQEKLLVKLKGSKRGIGRNLQMVSRRTLKGTDAGAGLTEIMSTTRYAKTAWKIALKVYAPIYKPIGKGAKALWKAAKNNSKVQALMLKNKAVLNKALSNIKLKMSKLKAAAARLKGDLSKAAKASINKLKAKNAAANKILAAARNAKNTAKKNASKKAAKKASKKVAKTAGKRTKGKALDIITGGWKKYVAKAASSFFKAMYSNPYTAVVFTVLLIIFVVVPAVVGVMSSVNVAQAGIPGISSSTLSRYGYVWNRDREPGTPALSPFEKLLEYCTKLENEYSDTKFEWYGTTDKYQELIGKYDYYGFADLNASPYDEMYGYKAPIIAGSRIPLEEGAAIYYYKDAVTDAPLSPFGQFKEVAAAAQTVVENAPDDSSNGGSSMSESVHAATASNIFLGYGVGLYKHLNEMEYHIHSHVCDGDGIVVYYCTDSDFYSRFNAFGYGGGTDIIYALSGDSLVIDEGHDAAYHVAPHINPGTIYTEYAETYTDLAQLLVVGGNGSITTPSMRGCRSYIYYPTGEWTLLRTADGSVISRGKNVADKVRIADKYSWVSSFLILEKENNPFTVKKQALGTDTTIFDYISDPVINNRCSELSNLSGSLSTEAGLVVLEALKRGGKLKFHEGYWTSETCDNHGIRYCSGCVATTTTHNDTVINDIGGNPVSVSKTSCDNCSNVESVTGEMYYECHGHPALTCPGHDVCLGHFTCSGHAFCSGHELTYCTGHAEIAATRNITTKNSDAYYDQWTYIQNIFEIIDDNGISLPVPDEDKITNDPWLWDEHGYSYSEDWIKSARFNPMYVNGSDTPVYGWHDKDSEEGQAARRLQSEIENKDWYELYGFKSSSLVGGIISPKEEEDLYAVYAPGKDNLPFETQYVIETAVESVGRIPYYPGMLDDITPGYFSFGEPVEEMIENKNVYSVSGLNKVNYIAWLYSTMPDYPDLINGYTRAEIASDPSKMILKRIADEHNIDRLCVPGVTMARLDSKGNIVQTALCIGTKRLNTGSDISGAFTTQIITMGDFWSVKQTVSDYSDWFVVLNLPPNIVLAP